MDSGQLPDVRARQYGPALEGMYRFVVWLTPVLDTLPRSQKFLLGDRMQTTALDVLEHLIEATFTRQRAKTLEQANLGLEKLRFFSRMAFDLHYIDLKRYEHLARTLDELGRLIGGWKKAHHAAQGD